MFLLVSQLRVDLVGHDKNILLHTDLRDLTQILLLQDGSRRIVRKRQYQNLCFLRDRVEQFLRRQAELVFLFQIDDHRHAARQNHTGLIGHIAGLGNQHFLPRVQHHTHADVDRLRTAHCDQDLLHRIILQILTSLHIVGDLLPQLLQSGVGCIECAPFLQRVDSLIPDVPGRVKVRLAHPQRNRIRHLTYNIKKFPDTRERDIHNLFS